MDHQANDLITQHREYYELVDKANEAMKRQSYGKAVKLLQGATYIAEKIPDHDMLEKEHLLIIALSGITAAFFNDGKYEKSMKIAEDIIERFPENSHVMARFPFSSFGILIYIYVSTNMI